MHIKCWQIPSVVYHSCVQELKKINEFQFRIKNKKVAVEVGSVKGSRMQIQCYRKKQHVS